MAKRELKELGIDPGKDFSALHFDETHDEVVYKVLNREVDAGTVRTGTLEALSDEGKIDLGDIRVFPRRPGLGEPPPYLLYHPGISHMAHGPGQAHLRCFGGSGGRGPVADASR